VRDATGALRRLIEWRSGCRARASASKASPRRRRLHAQTRRAVAQTLAGERIHRAESLTLIEVDRTCWPNDAAAARRMKFALSFSGGEVYLTLGTRR